MEALYSELMSQLNKMVYECIPHTPIVMRGMRWPSEAEEWIVFNGLAIFHQVGRQDDTQYTVPVEIISYSRHANARKDQRFNREWDMAQQYCNLFNRQRIAVKNTCIQFQEPRLIALDLSSLGNFAQGIQQSQPQLNCNAVVMEVLGYVSQSKD